MINLLDGNTLSIVGSIFIALGLAQLNSLKRNLKIIVLIGAILAICGGLWSSKESNNLERELRNKGNQIADLYKKIAKKDDEALKATTEAKNLQTSMYKLEQKQYVDFQKFSNKLNQWVKKGVISKEKAEEIKKTFPVPKEKTGFGNLPFGSGPFGDAPIGDTILGD